MRRIRITHVVMAAVLAVMCAGLPAKAQTLTGTIGGRVVDQQGAVLPGVSVTLSGKTGAQTQITDARGEFRFVGLDVGTYYSSQRPSSGFSAPRKEADAGSRYPLKRST